jgi:hypothetical protein
VGTGILSSIFPTDQTQGKTQGETEDPQETQAKPAQPAPPVDGRSSAGRAGLGIHLFALVFFAFLTAAMTWPLALHFNQMPGGLGDNVYFAFLIRWFARALSHPGTPLFSIPWLNYPAGWNLASTDSSLAVTLPAIPFLVFGDAAAYNAAMAMTFVLSGWAMFAWLRRLTGSTPAGLLAGTIFTFLPYRIAHYSIGHLNLAATQWFPLFFWGLFDLLRARRWAWKPALLAGIGLGLTALTSMYYLYMLLLIGSVFGVGYWLLGERGAPLRKTFWLNLISAAVFALPLTALGIYPFVQFARSGGIASRSLEYAAQYSASPTDFILPFAGSLVWSGLMRGSYLSQRWVEQSLYIGAVSLVLAVLAWLLVRRGEQRVLLKAGAAAILVSFILALGVQLNWFGQPVQTPFPMPDVLLFHYAPFFDKMRALARFGFFVPFFGAVFAGIGAAALFEKLRGRWGSQAVLPAAVILIALACLDFATRPGSQFTELGPRPVDEWLAQQSGGGALAQFPFRREVDQDLVYYTLYHGKPYIGGFFSANFPDQYWQIQPVLAGFPNPDSLEKLRELGVEFILVEESRYPDPAGVEEACAGLGMPLLARLDGIVVYGLPR